MFSAVRFGGGNTAQVAGMGDVHLISPYFPDGVSLHNVLYAPHCKANLISVRALAKDLDGSVHFTVTHCSASRNYTTLFTVPIDQHSYTITAIAKSQLFPSTSLCLSAGALRSVDVARDSPHLWHRRLGHPGKQQFAKLVRGKLLLDCPLTTESLHALGTHCRTCALGKCRKTPFRESPQPAPLELVHSDLMGPSAPRGVRGEIHYHPGR
jgi:hypothetical protein